MSWTDERVELLKTMWAEGKSASQIAKELGSVTRNAVIGKVHRLGLSSRTPDAGAASADAAKDVAAPKPTPAAASAPAEAEPTAPAAAAAPVEPAAAKPAAPQAAAEPAPVSTPEMPATVSASPPATTHFNGRRPIAPAGQPLPPQPSANEISPEALATVREVEKGARKLGLMELTERTCKWPIGDPATEHFWFCGLPSQTGKPYCEAHVSVAFQPMQSRRDRRR